ncbi:MAG: sulfurtransferase TusA family protein [Candidatus Eiseniibacteriota bacterium]
MTPAGPPRETEDPLVDARGLLCPLPVIRLEERMRTIPPGGRVLLVADDPAAEEDVRLWCRGHRHEVVDVARKGREARIRVRRGT